MFYFKLLTEILYKSNGQVYTIMNVLYLLKTSTVDLYLKELSIYLPCFNFI